MIVIVAPFPTKENEKDGMIQRIAAIDLLMKDLPRTYLEISLRRNFLSHREIVGNLTILRLNFFLHFPFWARLVRQARIVYVHSANNALKILPVFPKDKVIFDAHGVVPEETVAEGKRFAALILGYAERVAIRRSRWIVSVTNRMRAHFERKYGRQQAEDIIYPILPHLKSDQFSELEILQRKREAGRVIYAGGLQSWQNIDKMIAACTHRADLTYTFLTGDVVSLRSKLESAGLRNVVCESVHPNIVKDHYLEHVYGYILREPNLINEVACPTKLIEYLFWGVLPVVITPQIGDFDSSTLQCVTLDNFLADHLPDESAQIAMRSQNYATINRLITNSGHAKTRLRRLLEG